MFDRTSYGPYQLSSPLAPSNGGRHLWIQAQYGNDGNPGFGPDSPIKTMAKAFTMIKSGDTIHFTGKLTEQLIAPASIFDITIIGEGTRPRHADAQASTTLDSLGGRSAASWSAPSSPTATTPLLLVRQQGWRFCNILFAAPSDDAALEFIRDAASGDSERDSSHAEIVGCRFAGGFIGIKITGTEIIHNLLIRGNIFNDMAGVGGGGIVSASANNYLRRAIIEDNIFELNVNGIVCGMEDSTIRRNMFQTFTTTSCSLAGGTGLNRIYSNYLSGTYSIAGGYVRAAADDDWGGNWNTGVGVLTTADPA